MIFIKFQPYIKITTFHTKYTIMHQIIIAKLLNFNILCNIVLFTKYIVNIFLIVSYLLSVYGKILITIMP